MGLATKTNWNCLFSKAGTSCFFEEANLIGFAHVVQKKIDACYLCDAGDTLHCFTHSKKTYLKTPLAARTTSTAEIDHRHTRHTIDGLSLHSGNSLSFSLSLSPHRHLPTLLSVTISNTATTGRTISVSFTHRHRLLKLSSWSVGSYCARELIHVTVSTIVHVN